MSAADTTHVSGRPNGTVGSRADAELFGSELSVAEHRNLIDLDNRLHDLWALGENLVLGWAPDGNELALLLVPHYFIADLVKRSTVNGSRQSRPFYREMISGKKRMGRQHLAQVAKMLEISDTRVQLLHELTGSVQESDAIERIVRRYSVNYAENRAVALFDIVGFSLLSPFEQMTQLNSLSFSMNSAHSRMLSKQIDIRFARSTTGDGFYIWNRDEGGNANTNLYHFMHLVLADNAIARRKSRSRAAPVLRTGFHVGSCYEFHQAEGLSPTLYSYIVGDVTIDLARMVEKALPGQIMVGEFNLNRQFVKGTVPGLACVDAIRFIDLAQDNLARLSGLELSGEPIRSIKCYLTGQPISGGGFSVRRLEIHDKHGLTHHAFNAKVNIYRERAEPIYLGIEDRSLNRILHLNG